MKISVLICTYKREKLLDRCLQSLLAESTELPDEIVVIDGDGGMAKDIIDKWDKKNVPIKLITTANINLAASRNVGLRHCIGDAIALTDDDVIVSPDWIKIAKRLHQEHPEAGAIGGKIKSAGANTLLNKVSDLFIFPFPEKATYVNTVAGANASYKKGAIEKVGEYDETLFRGEDVDYNWRILEKGYKVYYDPELLVYHKHRSTWRGLFNQIYMYGRAYYLVRRKWKTMYCVYPHRLRNIKDILKLGYFFLGIIYESLRSMRKIEGPFYKTSGFFMLIFLQVAWRAGMIRERLRWTFR